MAYGGPSRATAIQLAVLAVVAGLVGWLTSNTINNLSSHGIATGFGFLARPANFAIGESVIPYLPSDSYGQALLVGLLNTLKVGLAGVVLASVLGLLVGLARLSTNWLAARLAGVYVETVRNVPLLLHLFFWYTLITEGLPGPRTALEPLTGVFLCNRGLILPLPGLSETPHLVGFNFHGGVTLSPELLALLLGLGLYTAAFIAEIVRSGIQAVNRGQTEAALALGLRSGAVIRLVVLPQALRVIVPPLTSQYLNLLKNSSLAVAIGYPDLVSILDTTINQTGQAIEGVALIMGVFLVISLSLSALLNWYNRRIAIVER